MRNRNKTLAGRVSKSRAVVTAALDVFESTARLLETQAAEQESVVKEAEDEVARLTEVRDEAYREAAATRTKAEKIRAFVE